ncbi:hypothetical protein Tco_0711533 [Tanacetum coccineum]
MQFLMGLDDMFSYVRSFILTTEPLLDVKSAFATLYWDESHRNSNMASKTAKFGPAAFVARPSSSNNWNANLGACEVTLELDTRRVEYGEEELRD